MANGADASRLALQGVLRPAEGREAGVATAAEDWTRRQLCHNCEFAIGEAGTPKRSPSTQVAVGADGLEPPTPCL